MIQNQECLIDKGRWASGDKRRADDPKHWGETVSILDEKHEAERPHEPSIAEFK